MKTTRWGRYSFESYWEDKNREIREWEERRTKATAAFTAEWIAATNERMELRPPRARGVYFVEAVGTSFVKIGWAEDIARRFLELQRMNGARLRLLRWESGGRKREKELHAQWAGLRVHGEWFIVIETLAHYMGHATSASMARVYEWLAERGEPFGIWGPDPDFGFREAA